MSRPFFQVEFKTGVFTGIISTICLSFFLTANDSSACTSLLVSKGASTDGSVMITYTADSAGFYPRLEIFPATDYPEGAVIVVPATKDRPVGQIRQVRQTYQMLGVVWDEDTSHGDHWTRQGCINEYQLAIAETTFGGRKELVNPQGLINYPMLMTLTLQRSKTAREAIDCMVALVTEYGYCDVGESISIADKEEAWVFEIVGNGPGAVGQHGGAIWVARKVPDGEISVHANQARIGEIPDKPDRDSFFYSDNIKLFAIEKGFFDPKSDKPFRFDDVYGDIDAKSKRVCEARVWSIFRRAVPSLADTDILSPDYHRGVEGAKPYPWSMKPDKKLSTADVMALMRDHYEGTEFDMTRGPDAEPYGMPRRLRPLYWKVEGDDNEYAWERPISTQQTGFSIVTQSRADLPDPIGGVLWYGLDDTYLTCYFPLYCAISVLPESFATGNIERFRWDSAWWVFNLVSNYANLKYSRIAPEIIAVQQELESRFLALQGPVEKTATELLKTDPTAAKQFLSDYSVMQAETVARRWKRLAEDIFTKYNDGYIRSDDGSYPRSGPDTGYPEGWLRRVLRERPEQYRLPNHSLKQ